MSKPVNVTNMDFGISDIDGIVELLPQGITQGKNPRPGLHIDASPEAHWKISYKFIRQGLLIIPAIHKQKDTGIAFKEEAGLKGAQAVEGGKYRVFIHTPQCLDPTESEKLVGKEVIVPDVS